MKNNNLKEKIKGFEVKTNPFQKVDPSQPIPISEIVGKAIGTIPVNTEESKSTIIARKLSDIEKENKTLKDLNMPKAYISGKDYFDQLKNNIKDCDPEIEIDLYGINIDSIPGKEGNERAFRVSLSTKCDNEVICTFNVENRKDSWADIINNLSKDIVGIIKKYQSGDLDSKSEGELLQKSMKERFEKITSNIKNKPEEKTEVLYPAVVKNTIKDEDPKIIDIVIDDNKVDFGLTEFEKRKIIDDTPTIDYPALLLSVEHNDIKEYDKYYNMLHNIINIITNQLENNDKMNNISDDYKNTIKHIIHLYKNTPNINENLLRLVNPLVNKVFPKLI